MNPSHKKMNICQIKSNSLFQAESIRQTRVKAEEVTGKIIEKRNICNKHYVASITHNSTAHVSFCVSSLSDTILSKTLLRTPKTILKKQCIKLIYLNCRVTVIFN